MLTPNIKAFYNEIDPYCCAWLSNLMDAGHITPGKIDDRPIQELTAADTKGYERCHFFAGIAGWELALNLANWGSGFVWTGSCPCQPFSQASGEKKKARTDPRHLWPVWFRLIKECNPTTIFGEQVDDAIADGWLDEIANDMENESYAVAAAVLPACSVGAPQERQRLFFCAYPECDIIQGRPSYTAADTWAQGRALQQLPGLLQPHAWPTLPDSKSWSSDYGIPSDVGVAKANKAIGNAIIPEVAAQFIRSTM